MNKAILTGRLTAAPEIKTTSSGKSVSEFTLAVDRFTDGEKQADFIRCTVWNKQAENLCKYKSKGDKIAVVGSVRCDRYKDNDGKDKYKNYILVSEIEYLDSKKQERFDDGDYDDGRYDDVPTPAIDDNLPF